MDANRKTAYFTLMDVETKHSYSNLALNHHIIYGKPDSVGFVRELVYGVLENKIYLDYIISQFIKNPIHKVKASDLTVLRMGIYQLRFMDSVPEYAAVNESVILAKKFCYGRDGFINGVLRSYLREKNNLKMPDRNQDEIGYLSVRYSFEPWIIELWLEEYDIAVVEELLEASNKTPDLIIRANTIKTTRTELNKKLKEQGYITEESMICKDALHVKGSELLKTKLYKNGMFSVQDESSMAAVNVLDPQPDEFIIDVCAAPGGKTLYIGEKMKNRGFITAWDIYKRKLAIIRKEADRLGITNIKTRTWDATKNDSSLDEKADRVLVDAPCSGLGVIRRKPEIKYKPKTQEFDDLPKTQLDILSASSRYLKPGGILVYSTCTISPYENQRVVRDFLRRYPSFTRVEEIQLLPHINNTDGFYICKMKKAGNRYSESKK